MQEPAVQAVEQLEQGSTSEEHERQLTAGLAAAMAGDRAFAEQVMQLVQEARSQQQINVNMANYAAAEKIVQFGYANEVNL